MLTFEDAYRRIVHTSDTCIAFYQGIEENGKFGVGASLAKASSYWGFIEELPYGLAYNIHQIGVWDESGCKVVDMYCPVLTYQFYETASIFSIPVSIMILKEAINLLILDIPGLIVLKRDSVLDNKTLTTLSVLHLRNLSDELRIGFFHRRMVYIESLIKTKSRLERYKLLWFRWSMEAYIVSESD